MASDGLHGSPTYAEPKGGAWSTWDRYVMRTLGKKPCEWEALRAASLAELARIQTKAREDIARCAAS